MSFKPKNTSFIVQIYFSSLKLCFLSICLFHDIAGRRNRYIKYDLKKTQKGLGTRRILKSMNTECLDKVPVYALIRQNGKNQQFLVKYETVLFLCLGVPI